MQGVESEAWRRSRARTSDSRREGMLLGALVLFVLSLPPLLDQLRTRGAYEPSTCQGAYVSQAGRGARRVLLEATERAPDPSLDPWGSVVDEDRVRWSGLWSGPRGGPETVYRSPGVFPCYLWGAAKVPFLELPALAPYLAPSSLAGLAALLLALGRRRARARRLVPVADGVTGGGPFRAAAPDPDAPAGDEGGGGQPRECALQAPSEREGMLGIAFGVIGVAFFLFSLRLALSLHPSGAVSTALVEGLSVMWLGLGLACGARASGIVVDPAARQVAVWRGAWVPIVQTFYPLEGVTAVRVRDRSRGAGGGYEVTLVYRARPEAPVVLAAYGSIDEAERVNLAIATAAWRPGPERAA